jgi:hypothetical protein
MKSFPFSCLERGVSHKRGLKELDDILSSSLQNMGYKTWLGNGSLGG